MAETLTIRNLSVFDNNNIDKAGKILNEVAATKILLSCTARFPRLYNEHENLKVKFYRLQNLCDHLIKMDKYKEDAFKTLKEEMAKDL